jgi:hypothetical protein
MAETIVASSAPTNKAVAATGGSAFGAAFATIMLYLMELTSIVPPDSVKAAITTILTALVTLGAAYFTPPGSSEAVVLTSDGKMKTARISK